MKNISIKKKILIWFTSALFIIVAITLALTFAIVNAVFTTDLQGHLENQVLLNADEIEYYNSLEGQEREVGDQYVSYKNGILEIDDDFCDYYNGVYTALIDSDNRLRYGECPVIFKSDELFTFTKITKYSYDGKSYFVFEKPLHGDNLDGLWLRGVASLTEGTYLLYSMLKFSWVLLPLIAVMALIGGYVITAGSFKPVEKIINAAVSINDGNDLSARIGMDENKNEINILANTFDSMFDRLEKAFQREKQFTSDVSHELRTPLSVILAQCELTLELADTEEEYREALELIQVQGKQMNDLITQLLFFSRAEQGRQPLNLADVNLSENVDKCCSQFYSHKNITLCKNVTSQIAIYADSGLINRIIINLINNAEQYGTPDGHINVTLSKDDKWAVLKVSDDGIGIDSQHLDKIWDRFYQVDPSRSSSSAGLGLSMVKEIVKLHHGEISVISQPGEGTEFTVKLPLMV